jgi:hypothetical protein
MSRRNLTLLGASLPLALGLTAFALLRGGAESLQPTAEVHRPAATYPDYSGAVIPPNIAPFNLQVLETGRKFCLRVSAAAGAPIEIFSSGGVIRIPPAAWRNLLQTNTGAVLNTDIYAKGEGGWTHFETVRNRIAAEEIDPYVVYRYIPPIYDRWDRISLRQRNLTSFDERILFDNQRSADASGAATGGACVNCHAFLNHGTGRMLLHLRPGSQSGQIPAMILVRDGRAEKVDTRASGQGPAAYIAWHPSGRLLAFSRNRLMQMFHTAGAEVREVVDQDSDLGLYDVDAGRSFTVPQISRPDRLETFPAWSPDGRYLYFSSAPFPGGQKNLPLQYDKVGYDLNRVSYDPATGAWGRVQTVVAASQLGRSISLAQISPDGRYLMFCGHDYGSFPIFQPGSDLFLVDLTRLQPPPKGSDPESAPLAAGAAAPRKLDEINSDRTDSYHCWSANSRWVIFSSKREDGMFARLYIAHLDSGGRFGRPFIMPQRDPGFYGRCLMTYNRPELIGEPVTVTAPELARAINSNPPRPADAPTSGAPAQAEFPWHPLK